jgi:hypothetical protein
MRVIIAGSRSITDPSALDEAMAHAGFEITEIITGDSRGVDDLAAVWARTRGIPCQIVPVEWNRYGGRAEQVRNDRISLIAEGCIAVWDGFSRGTSELVEFMHARGLQVCVLRCNPQETKDRKTTSFYRHPITLL